MAEQSRSDAEWWKSTGDRVDELYAPILLERLLKQPHARAFLGIADDEVDELRCTMNEMHQEHPQCNAMARSRYRQLISRLMKLPMKEPHMVVPENGHEGWVYLVLNDGKERLAQKFGDTYLLLYETQLSDEAVFEVESHMEKLATSKYFPTFKVVRGDQIVYIGVEFIEGTYPERGTDVSEFIAFCRQVGFGPDTNATNFKQTSAGELKYVDNDALEWLVDPPKHPFEEGSYAGRDKIW